MYVAFFQIPMPLVYLHSSRCKRTLSFAKSSEKLWTSSGLKTTVKRNFSWSITKHVLAFYRFCYCITFYWISDQIRNPAAYVRDYYFFKRSQYPQLELVHMKPEDAFNALQKQELLHKFVEIGKVLLTWAILKNVDMVS
jgi:hypothetical protein